jgi:patatin-like phospholipase/acyl hydrolase
MQQSSKDAPKQSVGKQPKKSDKKLQRSDSLEVLPLRAGPREKLRRSIEEHYVSMDEKAALELIMSYLANESKITGLAPVPAMGAYLEGLIKTEATWLLIEGTDDAAFNKVVISDLMQKLTQGKTLDEEGNYLLEKKLHELMIESAISLYNQHYTDASYWTKFTKVAKSTAKAVGQKTGLYVKTPLQPKEDPLAPEYKAVKRGPFHGRLLMKLLRSAVTHNIELDSSLRETAEKTATAYLAQLILPEAKLEPLSGALKAIKPGPKSRDLTDKQRAWLIEKGKKGLDEKKRVVVVLSLDGGGTRGLYTARLLQAIEEECGKPISEIFDVVSGTSTGGILALALNTPALDRPKFTGADAVKLYRDLAKTIFPIKYSATKVFWTVFGTQYDASALEALLKRTFGDLSLNDTIGNVVIPAYNLTAGSLAIFRTRYAKRDPEHQNQRLYEVARYTSAAPTYLTPADRKGKAVYVDGGIGVNNPSLVAYMEAKAAYPNAEKIMVVSLGTTSEVKMARGGNVGITNSLPVIIQAMDVQSQMAHDQLEFMKDQDPEKLSYFRLNEITNEPIDLADSSDQALDRLLSLATKTITREHWRAMVAALKAHINEK